LIAVVVVAPVAGARVHTCHRHSSSTDRPPAQQLKQQQQHGAWEQHLQLCDTEEGCTGCRVCEGTLFTPKIKESRFFPQTPRKKSPAARIVVTHSLGDGAARLPERARSPTPHTSTCGAPPGRFLDGLLRSWRRMINPMQIKANKLPKTITATVPPIVARDSPSRAEVSP